MTARYVRISLADPIYDEITDMLAKTYPNVCVLWMNRIENLDLEKRFHTRKEAILAQRGSVKELVLYHGTAEECVHSIAQNGFIADMNRTSAYGMGTYFATSADYSKSYAKPKKDKISFMIVSHVLIGKCVKGTANQVLNTKQYDNFVDNDNSPSIYVTSYNDGALPRYVVAFHRNAQ